MVRGGTSEPGRRRLHQQFQFSSKLCDHQSDERAGELLERRAADRNYLRPALLRHNDRMERRDWGRGVQQLHAFRRHGNSLRRKPPARRSVLLIRSRTHLVGFVLRCPPVVVCCAQNSRFSSMRSAAGPVGIATVVLLAAAPSFAVGVRVPQKDAAATARGNAFVATADNAAAVHYNPAGLTQLEGQQVRAGVFAFAPYMDFSSASGDVERKRIAVADPQLYCSWSSRELPFAVGLGLYSSYGFRLEWPDDAPFRTVGLRGELIYATLQPVGAWKLTDNLSIGGGPTINYATLDFRKGVAVPGDEFRFEADGSTLGYSVGILWKAHAMHSFGAIYRSATTIDFEGDTRLRVPFTPPFPPEQRARARFEFPQTVTAGYSFRPTPAWNLEVNVDWTDWDVVETMVIEQTPNLPL